MIFLLLAEAFRSRRGHTAWATCHTLSKYYARRGGWSSCARAGRSNKSGWARAFFFEQSFHGVFGRVTCPLAAR